MTFKDLVFKDNYGMGIQCRVFFENGYGASIIRTPFSYGNKYGQYELAVLKGNEEDHDICYDTPIANDVIGYLEPQQIDNILEQIIAL